MTNKPTVDGSMKGLYRVRKLDKGPEGWALVAIHKTDTEGNPLVLRGNLTAAQSMAWAAALNDTPPNAPEEYIEELYEAYLDRWAKPITEGEIHALRPPQGRGGAM